MAKTEDGEFELILGNRQLISVFLIVIILLGVFFSMGYIVGRNSAGPAVAATASTQPMKPNAIDRKDTDQASNIQPPSTDPVPPAPPPETKPVSPPPVAEKTSPQPAKQEPPKPEPPKPEKKTEPPQETPAPTPAAGDHPAPGLYWQVAASPRASADMLASALGKKGLRAVVVPADKSPLFRVLVGPYADAAAAAAVRPQLEDAGFKAPIKRQF